MPVLTDSEYETLRPHFDVIRMYQRVGQEVATSPRNAMAVIMNRVHNEEQCLTCAGAIARMYDLINIYLDEYEQER